mgnify:CR=1 FL=1
MKMPKPTGKKRDKTFADKWFAHLYGDSKAKEGVTYRNVFLEKMKKKSKIKKILNKKSDKTPVNVSSMQGDDKPNIDRSNEIVFGDQVGMPEEKEKKKKRTKPLKGIDLLKKRITFADFRKQSQEMGL